MSDCGYPLSTGKWDVVLQGETSIDDGAFHNLTKMYRKDGRSFWYHLHAPDGSYDVISTEIVRQIAYKISDFEYPFSLRNGMMRCKESYPLLLECFIIFIWSTKKAGNASDTIYELLMVYMVSIQLGRTLKLQTKCQILGTLSAQGNGMLCYKERHPLLLGPSII